MKKDARFTAYLDDFRSNLWGYHIDVPDDAAQVFLADGNRRVICTLNGQASFHCALMPKGDGTYYILVNKELRKKLRLRIGDEMQVDLVRDHSKYGMPMPEELGALLEMDDEGSRYFHELTPGKQRALIHLVGKPKTSDTRLKKALVIVDYLKCSPGKLDFKELQQAFKDSRDRF